MTYIIFTAIYRDTHTKKSPPELYNLTDHGFTLHILFQHICLCVWQVSLHPVLDKTTYHLINPERLAIMKKEAILVNASRGPVIDEVALVEHLKANPMFRVGLDVFEVRTYVLCNNKIKQNKINISYCVCSIIYISSESLKLLQICNNVFFFYELYLQDEPYMKPGLADMKNAVVVPHIASASKVGIAIKLWCLFC